MKRLAVILLAGATFIAAQGYQGTNGDVDEMTEQLKQKLHTAYENAGEKADKARSEAMKYQQQMRDKTGEEAEAVMEQRRTETHERLQGAIDALGYASEKVGCQVEEVRERIQSRLQEKREELIDLQERIQARKEMREMVKDEESGKGEGRSEAAEAVEE